MRLICAIVTHNRLDYSRRTIASWNDTAREDDCLVVVDNASTDGTPDWLPDSGADIVVLNKRNLFPGAACNIGWHEGLKVLDADLLMRSDNDVEYLDGWRDEVERAFTAFPKLGQLGLLNRHEDYDDAQPVTELRKNDYSVNVEWEQVGGNCVVRRKIWDDGFRWQPGGWSPGGFDEDSVAAAAIRREHLVATLIPTVANNMSFHRYEDFPEYYQHTATIRGLVPELSV